jgi:hypothetical protein
MFVDFLGGAQNRRVFLFQLIGKRHGLRAQLVFGHGIVDQLHFSGFFAIERIAGHDAPHGVRGTG